MDDKRKHTLLMTVLMYVGVGLAIVVVSLAIRGISNWNARRAETEAKNALAGSLVKTLAERLDAQTDAAGRYTATTQPAGNDPWGRPVEVVYEHGSLYDTLTVRSAGADGLHHTDDDLSESRRSVNAKGAARQTGEAAKEVTRGLFQGIRDGWRRGKDSSTQPVD
jgi:hypothetical protein